VRALAASAVLIAGSACASVPRDRFIASPNFGERKPGAKIDAIVIHTTEGTYEGAIRWFLRRESEVSAHFVVSPDGEITQMVPLEKRAWHATYYNDRSIGIEMAGWAHRPETWNERNLAALERLVAWLCRRYRIPPVHPQNVAKSREEPLDVAGIVGHGQIQPWNRSDPGPHFPWDRFVRRVRERLGMRE
jgi:N-acetyl-anhydromuramyl-L-alanine amidase AmpD